MPDPGPGESSMPASDVSAHATAPSTAAESIFLSNEDGSVTPTEHARGPWDPRALHGGAPAALIANAFEAIEPQGDLHIARFSVEFLRPVPLAPLRLTTRITRPGRRVQELEAELHADDQLVGRARALRLVTVPEGLPGVLSGGDEDRLPSPEEGREIRFTLEDSDYKSFAGSAVQMRFLEGGAELGPSTVWMRLRHPVLPDESGGPLARVAAAADFSNGVSAILPFKDYLFINADLMISLDRPPQGEWIALRARTLLQPGGFGWAESELYDERGRVGLATQALVVQARR